MEQTGQMGWYILWLELIFFFDTIALTIILIQLLLSGIGFKRAIGKFIGMIVSEAILLYIFMDVPLGCSIKILFKVPVASSYYFVNEIINDKENPTIVRYSLIPVRFVISTMLSDKEENILKELNEKDASILKAIENQILYSLVSCFHLPTNEGKKDKNGENKKQQGGKK